MTPESVNIWFLVLRDICTFLFGIFIVAFQLLIIKNFNEFWVGTGVGLMLTPAVLHLNKKVKKHYEAQSENENPS